MFVEKFTSEARITPTREITFASGLALGVAVLAPLKILIGLERFVEHRVADQLVFALSLGVADQQPVVIEEVAVESDFQEHFPVFLTLARTGLRLGEALGLQWGDIDFRGGFFEIRRAWVNGRITTTKTKKTRCVDATPQLWATLRTLRQRRQRADAEKRLGRRAGMGFCEPRRQAN